MAGSEYQSLALLINCGEGLYGPRWQSDIARDLGRSDRQVRRWAGGDPIPADVFADLAKVIQRRASELSDLADICHARAKKATKSGKRAVKD